MSLIFCQTLDQALLAFVIQLANKSGKLVGRTAVQKILYFLRVRGIKTNYKFDIYHYGPFCQQILFDLDLLLADGVIENKSTKSDVYQYAPADSIEELLQLHRGTLAGIEDIVTEVVDTLAGLKPSDLELIATLDYIYRQQVATGARDDLRKTVIERFQQVKKDKFSSEQIDEAFDAMVSAHLVAA